MILHVNNYAFGGGKNVKFFQPFYVFLWSSPEKPLAVK